MKFEVCNQNIITTNALIYMWEIYDHTNLLIGRYVGKAKGGSARPLKHYKRNINRLLEGQPYRKSNPNGYRKIHIALANAVIKNHVIKLYYLKNINENEDINIIEQEMILQQNCKGSESWQLNQ